MKLLFTGEYPIDDGLVRFSRLGSIAGRYGSLYCIHSKAANFLDKRGQRNVRADHQREGSEDTY